MCRIATLGLLVLTCFTVVSASTPQAKQSQSGMGEKMEPNQLVAEAEKIAAEDPFGLETAVPSDYSNWANVLSQVNMKEVKDVWYSF